MSGFSFRACAVMALAMTAKNFAIALVLMLALPSHGPVFDFLVSDVHAAKRAHSMAGAEDCDS
jgi:hypothetical protein